MLSWILKTFIFLTCFNRYVYYFSYQTEREREIDRGAGEFRKKGLIYILKHILLVGGGSDDKIWKLYYLVVDRLKINILNVSLK